MKIKNKLLFAQDTSNGGLIVLQCIGKMTSPESKLPAGIRHRFTRIRKAIIAEVKDANDSRIELCKEHGTLNEETDRFDFDDAGTKAFAEAFAELCEDEFEVLVDDITIDFDALEKKDSEIDVDAVDFLEQSGIVKIKED